MQPLLRTVGLLAIALWLGLTGAAPAWAYRVLPDNAVVGNLEGVAGTSIKISGQIYRLAPGSRIRDRNNRILVPTSAPQSGKVAFNFDHLGQVLGVWLLTEQEIPQYASREVEKK